MSGKFIATIYFYVISAGAIILMVIGIFNAVNFALNSTQYDKYPLRYGGISSCDYPIGIPYAEPAIKRLPPDDSISSPSAAEIERSRQLCLKNEESQRKQFQLEDLKNAVTFPLVGLILFLIHFPQARKQSKN